MSRTWLKSTIVTYLRVRGTFSWKIVVCVGTAALSVSPEDFAAMMVVQLRRVFRTELNDHHRITLEGYWKHHNCCAVRLGYDSKCLNSIQVNMVR